ncbi:MAG: hypothetical protein MK066_01795 [Crocinitomicaceae bacterium]|nr:hypothetical protein [Crocinitomicaceae bacterium]
MENLLSQHDLIEILRINDFALKTQLQIKKDFELIGVQLFHERSNNPTYDQLFLEVNSGLTEITQQGEQALLRLLYQIDIPERDFLKTISGDNFIAKMSQLIIRREAYKVYLRSQFG